MISPAADPATRDSAFQAMDSLVVEPRPHCGYTDLDAYVFQLDPGRGRPGDRFSISGPTLRGEDHRFAFGPRIEFWWNESVEETPQDPPGPGPQRRYLGNLATRGRCQFTVELTVPETPPGRYPIALYLFDYPEAYGFGFGWTNSFEVLP